MQNVFTIDADIKLKMLINEPTVVQNDNIRFIINVFDNGQPLDLTNVETVSLASVRLDRQTVVTPGTKIGTNTVQFDLGTEETKFPGRVGAIAQFYGSEGRVSTISFSYRVIKDPTGDGYIPTKREQTLIETVLGDGPLIIQQAQDAANFANEQGQFAQTQANAANEAATSANEAAQSAANAANEANAAATSANNAAASANAAADNANTKATNAQTQADYAKAQGDYAKAQGDYAKAQGDYAQDNGDYAKQVADENKTRWLTAVNTYADIATTYPNPQLGDTVQTIDDSKIYRWDGTQWVWTQQYNANAITDVQNKMTSLVEVVNEHLADDVSKGEVHGLRVFNGKLEYFDGQQWQRVKIDEQRIYGVRIDKNNSNPETRVTYIGDALGFTPMRGNDGNFQWGSWKGVFESFEIRPCVLKNKQVQYYLDPNDFTKKVDGSNAVLDGTDGDVMIEFGKTLWWKWTDEGDTYTIEISDKAFEGAVKHAFEIEEGYNFVPYYPLLLTQILFVIFFKTTNSQTALGRGLVDSDTGYASTGGTDKKGMFYGSTIDEQMKFIGIEDYWGNKFWWIDGLVADSNYNLLIGKGSFNNNGSGYQLFASGVSSDISGYINSVQGGNDKGFIIKSGGGSATTYYADYGYLYSARVALFGGYRVSGSDAGFTNLRLRYPGSYSHATFGARLFCASNGKIYIGAYLGTSVDGKLRSISGSAEPTGSKTIGTFRTEARANN